MDNRRNGGRNHNFELEAEEVDDEDMEHPIDEDDEGEDIEHSGVYNISFSFCVLLDSYKKTGNL